MKNSVVEMKIWIHKRTSSLSSTNWKLDKVWSVAMFWESRLHKLAQGCFRHGGPQMTAHLCLSSFSSLPSLSSSSSQSPPPSSSSLSSLCKRAWWSSFFLLLRDSFWLIFKLNPDNPLCTFLLYLLAVVNFLGGWHILNDQNNWGNVRKLSVVWMATSLC